MVKGRKELKNLIGKVNKIMIKNCPEEKNIHCINCSCNLCENDCQECDI